MASIGDGNVCGNAFHMNGRFLQINGRFVHIHRPLSQNAIGETEVLSLGVQVRKTRSGFQAGGDLLSQRSSFVERLGIPPYAQA